MKVTSREAAVERYGRINFATRDWPDSSIRMTLAALPDDLPFSHIYCNKDMEAPMLWAFNSLKTQGLLGLIKTFDGCFNIRMVRGTNDLFSAHSYGLAIDLNAAENPLGATSGGFYDFPSVVKCFTDQGFDWGGNFHDRKDPMHFSYCWE